MVKPTKLFGCNLCHKKYIPEENAIACHRPTNYWKCSHCGYEDHLSMESARKCCKEEI